MLSTIQSTGDLQAAMSFIYRHVCLL